MRCSNLVICVLAFAGGMPARGGVNVALGRSCCTIIAAGKVVGSTVIGAQMEPTSPGAVPAKACQIGGASREAGESGGYDLGPDVIVGDLQDVRAYGSEGGISAFSIGTTPCNIGTERVNWIARTNRHPVIAQALYRLKDNRFEQLGQSWVRHGFYAVSQSLCSPCNDPTNGSQLGVGCSGSCGSATINGIQTNMSPRSTVNAHTGWFPYPWDGWDDPAPTSLIERRIQVHNADLDPALNQDARYFIEGRYVTQDDAAAGNGDNNASYREVRVEGDYPGVYEVEIDRDWETQREQAAVRAWQDVDPFVV